MTIPQVPDEVWLLWFLNKADPTHKGHWLCANDCNPGFQDPLLVFESEAAAIAGARYQDELYELGVENLTPVCVRNTANTCRKTSDKETV